MFGMRKTKIFRGQLESIHTEFTILSTRPILPTMHNLRSAKYNTNQ